MKLLDDVPRPFAIRYTGADTNPYHLSHDRHGTFGYAATEREARQRIADVHSQWTRLGAVAGVMLDEHYCLTFDLHRLRGRSDERPFQLLRGNNSYYYASEAEARRAWCRLTGRPLAEAKRGAPRGWWSRAFGGTSESLETLHDAPRL